MKQDITEACIYRAVSTAYDMDPDELTGTKRRRNNRTFSDARQVTAYLLRVHTEHPPADIARKLQMQGAQHVAYCIQKTIGTLGLSLDFRLHIARIEVMMLEELAGE